MPSALLVPNVPFRFAAMQETIDQVGDVVSTSVIESGDATSTRAIMVQPLGDVTVSSPCQSYKTSVITSLVGCEAALRQASKTHACGALVMAYMCNVIWQERTFI